MEKKELRKKIAVIRESLTGEYMASASETIQKKVLGSKAFKDSKVIFAYIHMGKEPATDRIIEAALEEGKIVTVPKCLAKHQMIAVRIRSLDDLAPGSYGIMEPVDCSNVYDKEDIDLGIIPCISACKADGRRIGHGGGYYDAFMEGAKFTKLCICFDKLTSDEIPMEEYDQLMDVVITESE